MAYGCEQDMSHGFQFAGVNSYIIGQSKYRLGDTWNTLDSG